MREGGVKSPNVLDELESHLREEMERQAQRTTKAEQAFAIAAQLIGQPGALQKEFAKAGATNQARIRHFLLTLTGVLNPQHALNMNASNLTLNMEPRRATYFKATAFLLPAAFAWWFSVVFLLPKLQEFCNVAGMAVFTFREAPAIFRISGAIGHMMVFLTAHCVLISGIVILALALLEWRSNGWPRYRRTTVGAGIFVFNFAVLLSITLMVTSALVATTAIMHHVK